MQESKSCALPLGDSPLGKGGYRDSNPGPPEPQSGALTSCAIPTIYWSISLRTSLKGFEPPTHGLEGRCSIQLSYRLKKRVMGIEFSYHQLTLPILRHCSGFVKIFFDSL